MKKFENLVRRKEAGNYALNDAKIKKIEFIENLKTYRYIKPKILIPKLKNDIINLNKACDNMKNFEKFLEKK